MTKAIIPANVTATVAATVPAITPALLDFKSGFSVEVVAFGSTAFKE